MALSTGIAVLAREETPTTPRQIVINAQRFAYDPPVIRVNQGERVRLVLRSLDVTHGLALEGYEVNLMAVPSREVQAEFVASKPGKFRFRCTQTCGNLHPFMSGNLIVEPNWPLRLSLGLAGLLSIAFLGLVWTRPDAPASGRQPRSQQGLRLDLVRNRVTGWLLRRRAFQFTLFLPMMLVLFLVVVAGFRGSPVGNHNLAIILVWMAWWPLMALVLIPVGGRAWCTVCPIPAPGEWAQRLALVGKREGRPFSLAWRWPAFLHNMWPQNITFLAVAALSTVVLTTPAATAATLLSFAVLAFLLALMFRERSFCQYVCPVGGFIGLYSLAAPLGLRVRDAEVCRSHRVKDCLQGNPAGYGCPWAEYPGTMERNSHCGLCMECVKTCPQGNIAVGFQSPGHDLAHLAGRLDEAYRAFITLASALVYTVVMLGPWGFLKAWAASPLRPGYALYMALLLGISLAVIPGASLGAAYLFKRLASVTGATARQLWLSFSYALVPVGLLAWAAFTLTFFSAEAAYLPAVLSDPLGRGWDLWGTADTQWAPLFPQALPYLQTAAMLLGLAWGLSVLRRRTEVLLAPQDQRAGMAMVPPAALLFAITATFLWLFLG